MLKAIYTPDFLSFTAYRKFVQRDTIAPMVLLFDSVPQTGEQIKLPFTSVLDQSRITGISVVVADTNDLATWQQSGQNYNLPTLAQLAAWNLTILKDDEEIVLLNHPLVCLATAAARNNNSIACDLRMSCGKSYVTYRPGVIAPPALPMALVILFNYCR